jgi:hypothetical protein
VLHPTKAVLVKSPNKKNTTEKQNGAKITIRTGKTEMN